MPLLRAIPLLLLAAALLAACRTPERHQLPPVERGAYELVAQGASDVAGTFSLTGVGMKSLPAAYSHHDGCLISVTDGRLMLTEDGRYRIAITTARDCRGDGASPAGEVSIEGLYLVRGHRLRFGDMMIISNRDPAPEVASGDQALLEQIFPDGRMVAEGTVRHDGVTVTLRDFHTLIFARS
jgi:hypothetical protein